MTSTGAKGTRSGVDHFCPRHGFESCAAAGCGGGGLHQCAKLVRGRAVLLKNPDTRLSPPISRVDPATQLLVTIEDARERGWVTQVPLDVLESGRKEPEPGTWVLTGAGMLALAGAERRLIESRSNPEGKESEHGAAEQQRSE